MSKHKCNLPRIFTFFSIVGSKYKCPCGQKWRIEESKNEIYSWNYKPVKEWHKVKGEQK